MSRKHGRKTLSSKSEPSSQAYQQIPSKIPNEIARTTRKTIVRSSAKEENQELATQISAIRAMEKSTANSPEQKQLSGAPTQSSRSMQTNETNRRSIKISSNQLSEDVRRAFATDDIFLLVPLISQLKLSSFLGHEGDPLTHTGNHKYVVGLMQSIGPRDGLEALLAMHMAATHSALMRCLARANIKDQTEHGQETLLNRAQKLMRTFTMQMEALKKYRSNGEQHCTVEHVHVHNGGQAVVGTINQGRLESSDVAEDGRNKNEKK